MPRRVTASDVRLVVWDEAHRMFGPDFRRHWLRRMDDERRHIYGAMAKIRRFCAETSCLLVGPSGQLRSHSMLKDELLRPHGRKLAVGDHGQDCITLSSSKPLSFQSTLPSNDHMVQRSPRHRTGLFDLPGELRNQIYDLAMESAATFKVTVFQPADCKQASRIVSKSFLSFRAHVPRIFDFVSNKWSDTEPTNMFALPQTNRKLAEETLPVFYSNNIFEIEAMGVLNLFLRTIGDSSRFVRQITIPTHIGFFFSKRLPVLLDSGPLLALRSLSISHLSLLLPEEEGHRGSMPIDYFVIATKDYLLDWHDAHKDANGCSGVLDLIQITRVCPGCRTVLADEGDDCTKHDQPCPKSYYGRRRRINGLHEDETCCVGGCQLDRLRKIKQRDEISEALDLTA